MQNETRLRAMGALVALTTHLLCSTPCAAFGGKPPEERPNTPPAPTFQQAKPYRVVELARVTAPVFPIPNGEKVDITSELNTLIDTTINSSHFIRTMESKGQSRLIVSGGITALEMNILQLGLTIGWNKGGVIPIPGQPNASGEVDFRLSSLAMDFKIYDRLTGQTYLASYTDQDLSQLKIQVHVNLTNLQAAIDVLYKTGMSEAIRIATANIMSQLEANPQFDYIPWEAEVLGVDPESGQMSFNAGSAAGVRANDVYSVYSACVGIEVNCYTRFLADMKTSNVGGFVSEARGFSSADQVTNIRAGDHVYVKPLIQVAQ